MQQQAPTTPAEITLADGKKRVLRFSNGALKKIKEEFGASLFKGKLKELLEQIDESKLPRILVLALDHKWEGGEPGITEEQLDDLIDAQMLPDVIQKIVVALGGSFPDQEKKDEAQPIPQQEPIAPKTAPLM